MSIIVIRDKGRARVKTERMINMTREQSIRNFEAIKNYDNLIGKIIDKKLSEEDMLNEIEAYLKGVTFLTNYYQITQTILNTAIKSGYNFEYVLENFKNALKNVGR